MIIQDTPVTKDAIIIEETPVIETKTNNSTQLLEMPTTYKVLRQIQCLACSKVMSAQHLRYSHSKYDVERATEDQPEERHTSPNNVNGK